MMFLQDGRIAGQKRKHNQDEAIIDYRVPIVVVVVAVPPNKQRIRVNKGNCRSTKKASRAYPCNLHNQFSWLFFPSTSLIDCVNARIEIFYKHVCLENLT